MKIRTTNIEAKASKKNKGLFERISNNLGKTKKSLLLKYNKYKREKQEIREYKHELKQKRLKKLAEHESSILLEREKKKLDTGEKSFGLEKFKIRM